MFTKLPRNNNLTGTCINAFNFTSHVEYLPGNHKRFKSCGRTPKILDFILLFIGNESHIFEEPTKN